MWYSITVLANSTYTQTLGVVNMYYEDYDDYSPDENDGYQQQYTSEMERWEAEAGNAMDAGYEAFRQKEIDEEVE